MTPSAPDNSGARRVADPESPTEGGTARRASGGAGFSGSLGWTVLGTIIPGLGLWKAGRRVAGGTRAGGLRPRLRRPGRAPAHQPQAGGELRRRPRRPAGPRHRALAVVAVLWVAVIGFSHLALRPSRPSVGQRAAGAAVVGLLSFLVAAPMAVGANVAWTTGTTLDTIIGGDDAPNSTQPTINAGRPVEGQGPAQLPDPRRRLRHRPVRLRRRPHRHRDRGVDRHPHRRDHPVHAAAQHREDAVPDRLAAPQVLPERLHRRAAPTCTRGPSSC